MMLAADSIVFRGLLRKHPHAHPLIYMRGGDQHPDGGGAGLHLPRPDDPAGPGEFSGPGRELGNPGAGGHPGCQEEVLQGAAGEGGSNIGDGVLHP